MTTKNAAEAAKIAEFLSTPRTLAAIAKELKLPEATLAKVRGLKLPDGVALFEQRDALNVPLYAAKPQPVRPAHMAPAYDVWCADREIPYLWIQLRPGLRLERLKIVPLSDVHYGAKAHSGRRFREYIKWIASNDEVFGFLNGDITENAIDGSIGGAVYESVLTPHEQIFGSVHKKEPGIIELLRPIAHKLLWAQPGNHEWRTWKKTNLDPLEFVCRELGIPYFSEPVYADVLAWGHRFTFYCHHGTTGSNTKGGKMNAALRPAEFQEAVDFIIMGHVHDSMANPISRVVREREFDERGRLKSIRLVEKSQYTLICPSFHGYFGSYGSRAGYAPGSWGSVACHLFKDGSYRSSE